MLLILFARSMKYGDNNYVYIVPKLIKKIDNLKANLKREKQMLANTVEMFSPFLVGEYNITRGMFIKVIKEDAILKANLNDNLFSHWKFTISSGDLDDKKALQKFIDDCIWSINQRLILTIKRYEMVNFNLNFRSILTKHAVIDKYGFVKEIKRYSTIEEEN